MNNLEKRTHVYIERPKKFEISGCSCGNNDPDWSEYKKHLWCKICEKDFVPEHWGILDGPVGINTCEMIGIYFDQIELETGKIEPGPNKIIHFVEKRAII